VTEVEEMVDLLRYANYRKVADALRVSKTAVSNWARGRDVNPLRVRQVRDLLRPETAREAAPPEWAERLQAQVEAIAGGLPTEAYIDRAKGEVIATINEARDQAVEAMVRVVTARVVEGLLGQLPQQLAESAHESPPAVADGTR
jgi:transcriptional regulator with XRE-family HTH domain